MCVYQELFKVLILTLCLIQQHTIVVLFCGHFFLTCLFSERKKCLIFYFTIERLIGVVRLQIRVLRASMSQISSANVLTCRGDPFGGVTVNSSSSLETDFDSKLPTVDEAQQKLECSLNHWIHEKINGVWFEVDIKVLNFSLI